MFPGKGRVVCQNRRCRDMNNQTPSSYMNRRFDLSIAFKYTCFRTNYCRCNVSPHSWVEVAGTNDTHKDRDLDQNWPKSVQSWKILLIAKLQKAPALAITFYYGFDQTYIPRSNRLPIVDAGVRITNLRELCCTVQLNKLFLMRQLQKTGWMHNRVQMIAASFLTKRLLHNWQHGERYFTNSLTDGDFASNNGGWHSVASIRTDAQLFFRISNPVCQHCYSEDYEVMTARKLCDLVHAEWKVWPQWYIRQAMDSRACHFEEFTFHPQPSLRLVQERAGETLHAA